MAVFTKILLNYAYYCKQVHMGLLLGNVLRKCRSIFGCLTRLCLSNLWVSDLISVVGIRMYPSECSLVRHGLVLH
jgi:hypothetical protein